MSAEQSTRYRAFISYSHVDKKSGDWLHKALETYRVPKGLVGQPSRTGPVPKRLYPIFRDREELPTATSLGEQIEQALEHSDYLIVICSPRSAKSMWVNEEILQFKRLGRSDRILAIIVDGEPNGSDNPGLEVQECFPPALRFELGDDDQLSDIRTEPIAADARKGKDGRQAAKLKLIAGLIGVKYDALAQREKRRKRQQRTALSAAFMFLVLTLAGVWYKGELARQDQLLETNHNYGLALIEKAEARSAEAKHQEALFYQLYARQKLRKEDQPSVDADIYSELAHTPLALWSTASAAHHGAPVNSVAVSPDGTRLASGSNDNTIKLWNIDTGELLSTLAGYSGSVESVAFSPDGARLASGSRDNTVKIWDVETGVLLSTLEGHSNWVNSVAFSPDGVLLASGSRDNTIKLWNAETGALQLTLEEHSGAVYSVAFSPDGSRIASGSRDSTIKLWNVSAGELHGTIAVQTWVYSVDFSPDGVRLASGSADGSIQLWNAQTLELLTPLEAGSHRYVNSIVFSPDGMRLASASAADNTITLWSIREEKIVSRREVPGQVNSIAYSRDGRRLAVGLSSRLIQIIDTDNEDSQFLISGHSDEVTSLDISPDGDTLASGAHDQTIKLWDVASGKLLSTLIGHSWIVTSVAFSPDGTQLASGSEDRTIKLWHVRSGEEIATLKGHSDDVTSVAFSPDGARLASASEDGTIKVWDVGSGDLQATFGGHSTWVRSVSFSPDGARLASGSGFTIKLWDIEAGALLSTMEGHSDWIRSVSFSPDGTQLASGSGDHTVRLWDARNGETKAILEAHSDSVNSVSFSADGTILISGSNDQSIKLWDVSSGELLATIRGHVRGVNSVDINSSLGYFVSASGDGTIKLWSELDHNRFMDLQSKFVRPSQLYFFSNDQRLAVFGQKNAFEVWDIESGILLAEHESLLADSVSFDFAGKLLAFGSKDGSVTMVNIDSGASTKITSAHPEPLSSVAFSSDGSLLASGSVGGNIKVWNTDDSELKAEFVGQVGKVESMDFSSDGAQLMSASDDLSVNIWSVNKGTLVQSYSDLIEFEGQQIRFSDCDTHIISERRQGVIDLGGSGQGVVKKWDLSTGEIVFVSDGLEGSHLTVANSEADLIAHVSNIPGDFEIDFESGLIKPFNSVSKIRLSDVESGKAIDTLPEESGIVLSLSFGVNRGLLARAFQGGKIVITQNDSLSGRRDEKFFSQLLSEQESLTGYRLEGLNLTNEVERTASALARERTTNLKVVEARNSLFAAASGADPIWHRTTPFFWLQEARQGDTDAMIQAGNAFFRRKQYDQARHWFEQALAQGDDRAEERLELLDRDLARKE